MSHGARNCPFLTLTTRPVFAAATNRSVCRQRNAGICKISTAAATRGALLRLVHVGEHRHARVFRAAPQRSTAPCRGRARARSWRWCGSPCRTRFCRRSRCQPRRDLLERSRHVEGMRPALQRARPRDQGERQPIAEAHLADGNDRHSDRHFSASSRATMKAMVGSGLHDRHCISPPKTPSAAGTRF